MGGGLYDTSHLRTASTTAAATGKPLFAHTAAVRSGAATGPANILDPKQRNKAGEFVRECFDSDDHPNSRAVFIALDGTGSMADRPEELVKTLPNLMATLVKEGWLAHPSILFSKVCDHHDSIPLELGQFENGNKIDTTLTSLTLTGGGVGPTAYHEAYNLILFVAAYYTKLDCFTKRKEKGYLFFIGDENLYPTLTKQQIKAVFDIDVPEDISRDKLLEDARKLYNIHWIIPSGTLHWKDEIRVTGNHRRMFGENFHELEDPNAICGLIAGIIAMQEGYDQSDVCEKIIDVEKDPMAAKGVTTALAVYGAAASGTLAKKGQSSDALVEAEETTAGSTRL